MPLPLILKMILDLDMNRKAIPCRRMTVHNLELILDSKDLLIYLRDCPSVWSSVDQISQRAQKRKFLGHMIIIYGCIYQMNRCRFFNLLNEKVNSPTYFSFKIKKTVCIDSLQCNFYYFMSLVHRETET